MIKIIREMKVHNNPFYPADTKAEGWQHFVLALESEQATTKSFGFSIYRDKTLTIEEVIKHLQEVAASLKDVESLEEWALVCDLDPSLPATQKKYDYAQSVVNDFHRLCRETFS